jgi:tetratricopeptide (TPR) repeat protein
MTRLRRAVSAFRGTDISREDSLRWLWLACHVASIVWDYPSWDVLSDRQLMLARDAGALIALPIALNTRPGVHLFAGEFTEAASLVAQAESVTDATGSSIAPYGALALAVFRGREAQAAHLTQAITDDVQRRGEGAGLSFVQWAAAVLANSLGRYEEALAAAQRASEDSPAVIFASWALVELIEAAARSGAPERAAGALQRLSVSPATAGPPRASTARRSTASAVPACAWS